MYCYQISYKKQSCIGTFGYHSLPKVDDEEKLQKDRNPYLGVFRHAPKVPPQCSKSFIFNEILLRTAKPKTKDVATQTDNEEFVLVRETN